MKTEIQALDPEVIVEYLNKHPDFFNHFPDALAQLELAHQQVGAVSLLERQQKTLREQVKKLQTERATLIDNARKNEHIFRHYSDLYVALLACQDLDEMMALLQQTFIQQLGMVELSLRLFEFPASDDTPELTNKYRFLSESQSQLLKKRVAHEPVYLGRLTKEETAILFQNEAVESVAILAFGHAPLGMLAFGSLKAHHFNPDMDFLLITQLQALLSYKVASFLRLPIQISANHSVQGG